MLCTKCNSENPEGSKFCQNCGSFLEIQQVPVPVPVKREEEVSVGMWIGIFLINIIPCIGPLVYIIMMFIWAFGETPKKALKNFAKANLILILIGVSIAIVVTIFGGILGRFFNPNFIEYYRY